MRLPSSVKRILKQKITHEQKILLFQQELQKRPDNNIIKYFIIAEEHLIKKHGSDAANIYGKLAEHTGASWLLERQAKTLTKYAYTDIGSGMINKSFDIFTGKLGLVPEKAWRKIAEILRKSKGYAYAAQCYSNAGLPGTAARMSQKIKDAPRAAWYYEQSGEWSRAASMYKRAKLFDKAGDCFAKSGDMKKAVLQWKKSGTLEKHNIGPQTLKGILSRKD